MEIVFDARVIQDHFPGIGRYTYNLLAALPACLNPNEKLIILHDPTTRNSHYDFHRLTAVNARILEYRVPIFSLRNLAGVPQIPASDANRIYHFPYYLRPYRVGRPSVTTIYDLIAFIYPQLVPSLRTRLPIQLFNWLAIHSSRVVITISKSAADDIARFFPFARSKVTVAYGAPDNQFTPQSQSRCDAVRAKYNLSSPFVLCFGSNKPHKNLPCLLDAWQLLRTQKNADDRMVLLIAGHQDPRHMELQENVERGAMAASVRFLGEVANEDVPALYSACELFVFPSLYEGFGLPPLEAMACGAPVVCSNTSSLPEVVGDAAILFDPHDPNDIATACARVLGNPQLRDDLRRRSLRQATHFTWTEAARRTLDVYRHLASHSGR